VEQRQNGKGRPDPDAGLPGLLVAYRPHPEVPDEIFEAEGVIRPVWRPFLRHLARMEPGALDRAFARGDQYLNDAGVFFRQYAPSANGTERAWPLSHVPVILSTADWAEIESGLAQRADLLEALCADLYGEGRLVRDGLLPAQVVTGSPEWLRPLVGVKPPGGHFLHLLAFEIGRNPDGTWFVLGDRTQAPSGAGFALENRLATSRVFADFYPGAGVRRLAPFFDTLRDTVQALQGPGGGRAAILSPGPMNDTYFEHTYIARHLGFLLLEGEDLTVVDGRAMVRTIAGPRPLSVLWRRVDSAFCDPLELDETSAIGTPGLVAAVRSGGLTMLNALGTGVLETRALLAFLPALAEPLTGEALRLPNIATWWCGQAAERDWVLAHLDRVTVGSALSNRLPFDADAPSVPGDADGVDARIRAAGADLVAQEHVTLSTTPAFVNGALAPRPMTLRVFLARRADGGWAVMPGGYARIGRSDDASALAMQRGGSVADVWIAGQPDARAPAPPARPPERMVAGLLPARAADNLFWLGRYVERAEGIVRVLRAYHLRLAESGRGTSPLIEPIEAHLEGFGIDPSEMVPKVLIRDLDSAAACASKVRDRFSVDGWAALTDLRRTAGQLALTVAPGDDCARAMGVLLRKIAGFAGLVHDYMYRFAGWRFLTLGRALESADRVTGQLLAFADEEAPEGALDLCVELCDSVMSHRRRYTGGTTRWSVIDLLALDADNPQALAFHLATLRDQAARLPQGLPAGHDGGGPLSPLLSAAMRAETGLVTRAPGEVTGEVLSALRDDLYVMSDIAASSYLR
jgi:uncharacterized circularly permuted ATP-grasp superfamily protein/uncharacterized alpha-E superfamily protein